MRVQIVDPPAYTPPYDRSLCAALAKAGAEVELLTSRFAHGPVPPADGYIVRESFYPLAGRRRVARGRARRPVRALEHAAGMARFRMRGSDADVVHYQWLSAPRLDWALLPKGGPRVLTPHGWLRTEAWERRPSPGLRRLFDRMDAIVALSEYGAARLTETAGVPPERVRVIPHGAFDYLTRLPEEAPLPAELEGEEGKVVLAFGLIRPYKGTDVLIDAMAGLDDAELWIVGRPMGVDLESLRRRAAERSVRVRFVSRFVRDQEIPAIFRRADVVALPYRDAEQSGVLYTALAFAKPIVLSDVGGFPEVAARGAARLVTAGDPRPLRDAIEELIADPEAMRRLSAAARRAAEGPYSWDAIAQQTMALYRELLR
jgi:glycosyltransferase involved in cell wall biosynthesis